MDDIMNEGAGGPPSAFTGLDRVGDKVAGFIIGDPQKKPEIDQNTGLQKTFTKTGDPKWLWVVPIQTELREDVTDDGRRSLWLAWKSLDAFTNAVRDGWHQARRDGKPKPEYGGYIEFEVVGIVPTGFGSTKSRNWKATYVPPSAPPAAAEMMESAPTSPVPQPPATAVAQHSSLQRSMLDRMREQAAAQRAGGTPPLPAHHGGGEPPF